MSLSAAQLIALAVVCAEALRLRRVASNLTQADIVERCEGTTGLEQFVLIERGKWPLVLKQCTAIAKAMDLTAEGEAQLPAACPHRQGTRAPDAHAAQRQNQSQAACV